MLSGNSAINGYGGGAGDGTLNNCTLTGNSFTSQDGYGGGAAWGALNNCIIYFNQVGADGPGWANHTDSSKLNYCCTGPLLPDGGVGNITSAPLFLDSAGGNLRLRSDSPCINAGNNAYAIGGTDLDGRPRIMGGTVDIGSYEDQGPGLGLFIGWLQQYSLPTDGSADSIDSDGDGLNNWQEWIAGTDPTNADSALRLYTPTNSASGITVSWPSVNTRMYFLQRSTNLDAQPPFFPLATNLAGQTGTTTYEDTNAVGAGPFFYRLGVTLP